MNGRPPKSVWSSATWEGARREELRRWRRLPLAKKFEALDQLNALAATLIKARKDQGLPYFDPASGQRVPKR